jgi:hypothetical protein
MKITRHASENLITNVKRDYTMLLEEHLSGQVHETILSTGMEHSAATAIAQTHKFQHLLLARVLWIQQCSCKVAIAAFCSRLQAAAAL